MQLSLVIPVLNESASLTQLRAEIAAMAQAESLEVEIILVDDGSTDGTWNVITALSAEDNRVRGIRLRRNFGKAAALTAGVRAARAPRVATLDGDLQDDPAELPKLLAMLEQGFDVVSGWKRIRKDPFTKVIPSRIFNAMIRWVTGVPLHDHNCGLKLYRAEVFREVRIYGELHRFIPVLAAARGFRVGEVEVRHRPRGHGRTKYGAERFLRGFLDLMTVKFLTGYGQRPQHLLGLIGLLAFGGGLLGMVYLSIIWCIRLFDPQFSEPLHNRPLLLYSVAALLLGFQMVSMGLLAALLTAQLGKDADQFSIAETVGPPGAAANLASGSLRDEYPAARA